MENGLVSKRWTLDDEDLEDLVSKLREKSPVAPTIDDARIYVNRSLSMNKIKAIGFDMDYTLIEYKSPEYEALACDMVVRRLMDVGYPKDIVSIEYDANFPTRGLLFDKKYGNFLKVDGFRNILEVFHGFSCLSLAAIRELYPNRYAPASDPRYHILNTLFELPEIFILAALVNYFDNHESYKRTQVGVEYGSLAISYESIQQDVRQAVDWVHREGLLKTETLRNVDKYVAKEPRLPAMLDKLRQSGVIVFLATNSDYKYSDCLLRYALEFSGSKRSWKTFFDYIFVDAQKPKFFQEGSTLREIDESTGSLKLGQIQASKGLEKSKVYAGGSSELLAKYISISCRTILYVGDHIFGDIIKSKKQQAMRTFLVIPELKREVSQWEDTKGFYVRLQNLEILLREYGFEHSALDTVTGKLPDVLDVQQAIKSTSRGMEEHRTSTLGSLLRCGPRQTFFAYQATRFADLYASSCTSLLHYSVDFHFIAPHSLMPHETMLLSDITRGHTPALDAETTKHRNVLPPPDFTDDDEEDGNS